MGVPYTSSAAVQTRMGAVGVSLRTNDDASRITQAIADASTEIDGYALLAYPAAALAASSWVEKQARDLSVFYLCAGRLNPIPQSVQTIYENCIKNLEKVRGGSFVIPDAAQSKCNVPVMSNVRIRMTPVPHTDVEMGRSTGTPDDYLQFVDPVEQYFDYTL